MTELEQQLAARYGLEQPGDRAPENQPGLPVEAGIRTQEKVEIRPGTSIGPLTLGMTPEEILQAVEQLHRDLGLPKAELQIARTYNLGDHTLRYYDGDLAFYLVTYEEGKAVSIALHRMLSEHRPVSLDGLDPFRTTAEELMDHFQAQASMTWEGESQLLATDCRFESLGLRFWREQAYHPSLLEDPAWVEKMQAVLADERPYEYFEIVEIF